MATKKKNPAAVALGKQRMAKLTKAERLALGRKAIATRWSRRAVQKALERAAIKSEPTR